MAGLNTSARHWLVTFLKLGITSCFFYNNFKCYFTILQFLKWNFPFNAGSYGIHEVMENSQKYYYFTNIFNFSLIIVIRNTRVYYSIEMNVILGDCWETIFTMRKKCEYFHSKIRKGHRKGHLLMKFSRRYACPTLLMMRSLLCVFFLFYEILLIQLNLFFRFNVESISILKKVIRVVLYLLPLTNR